MKKDLLSIGLTDTHLSRNTLEDSISIFSQVIQLALDNGLKKVYHYGDIFTNRSGQSLDILFTFFKIVKMFEEAQITLIAIPGNHDKVHLNSENSYLDLFSSKYFKVIDSGYTESVTPTIDFHFLPYFKEVDIYPKLLRKLSLKTSRKKTNFLFTHVAVNGVKNNDGSAVDNNLTRDSFKDFEKIFVGHYHNRSQVGDKVYYIGSAFPQNFGEDNDKGFLLIYSDGSHEYHKPKFKEYHSIEVPVDELDEFLADTQFVEKVENGDQVRFIISGEDIKLTSLDKSKVTKNGISIKLKSDKIEHNIEEAESNNFVSFSTSSVKEAYLKFCEENKYNEVEGIQYLTKLENVGS